MKPANRTQHGQRPPRAGVQGSGPHGEAEPPQPAQIDARHARRARTHSTFVSVMKWVLPSLAAGLIVVFVFYTQGGFAPDLPENVDFDPGDLSLEGGGIKMVSPKLSGLDDNNQRFEVTAASAIQDRENPGMVTLDQIRARMALDDGGWVSVEAAGGVFRSDESNLVLKDSIEVTMSSGYVAKLNGATVDFKRGSVVTDSPVLVFMNAGIIAANAMEILEKGRRVRFTERATMTINGDPAEMLQENGL